LARIPAFHASRIVCPDRRFVTNESKARTVTQSQLDKVRDGHARMSLVLQQAFGLRREEAMKFQPIVANPAPLIGIQFTAPR